LPPSIPLSFHLLDQGVDDRLGLLSPARFLVLAQGDDGVAALLDEIGDDHGLLVPHRAAMVAATWPEFLSIAAFRSAGSAS
jgi:hypothetical protein